MPSILLARPRAVAHAGWQVEHLARGDGCGWVADLHARGGRAVLPRDTASLLLAFVLARLP